ncbi:DUF3122 domain-containing protein [Crocosphaera sp. XPORK-15E]|uniref:DUF3122 domain-containing protein n=1 Tax=Crocosphaera sp. XPORK-15E TaxID=3110247 RepID=UPI002B1F2FD8|nr:DUF3122 domain-containing protein [Crocosphaera sp. XPORK-15E]MEA5537294.1 DUF3122 domain-containing protein [Crocosphaera sp. XPORK-15E]
MKKLLILILSVGLILLLTDPAYALIRETKTSANTILYQSRQTLRDTSDHSWQIVFFKQIKDDKPPQINLRLVGFPDVFEFAHPQPLIIKIKDNVIVKVPDIFANDKEAFAPNVGQYDFTPILNQLESNNFWVLELPLKNNDTTLKIPYFILEEWTNIIMKPDLISETLTSNTAF